MSTAVEAISFLHFNESGRDNTNVSYVRLTSSASLKLHVYDDGVLELWELHRNRAIDAIIFYTGNTLHLSYYHLRCYYTIIDSNTCTLFVTSTRSLYVYQA